MKSRKLIHPHELKMLPVGAIVANGSKIGEEWVFRKTPAGKWMLYDLDNDDLAPHYRLTSRHPEWGAGEGFDSLNLPAYVLSRSGKQGEALAERTHWRRHKTDWMGGWRG